MDIAHVNVVTEQERKQGQAVGGWILGIFFTVIVGYFAVVYWPVTLTVLGVILAVALISEFCT